jgi:hypothetical protein
LCKEVLLSGRGFNAAAFLLLHCVSIEWSKKRSLVPCGFWLFLSLITILIFRWRLNCDTLRHKRFSSRVLNRFDGFKFEKLRLKIFIFLLKAGKIVHFVQLFAQLSQVDLLLIIDKRLNLVVEYNPD